MSSKHITIRRANDDVFAAFLGTDAVLTTEHPASSYGLPVVLVDGQPVNPSDVEAILYAEPSAEWLAMDSEYVSDADSVSLGETWDRAAADARRAATPRYDAETLALLDAARQAGYVVRI